MAYTHCQYVLGSRLGEINFGMFLWVDVAAGFVSVSGFVTGLAATAILTARGMAGADAVLRSRIRTIVVWHIASVLVVVLLVHAIAVPGADLGTIQESPILGPILVGLFVMPDNYFDVLTMFFFFLLLSPLALRVCERSSPWTLTVVSSAVWIIGQTAIDRSIMGEFIDLVGAVNGVAWGRVSFSFPNWQIVFFVPFALGFAVARDPDIMHFVRSGPARHIFYVCVSVFVALLILRTAQTNLPSSGFLTYLRETMDGTFSKQRVAGGFLLTFVVSAFMFVYLLSRTTAEASGLLGRTSRALRHFFTRPALVGVGQTSIYVFSTNTMYVYLLKAVGAERFGEGAKIALMAGSLILALAVVGIVRHLKARPQGPA